MSLQLHEIILLSVAITLTVSFFIFKFRSWILGRLILTTQIYTLNKNSAYVWGYRHSFLNGKHMELTLLENDDKTYIVKEVVYYNYKKDVAISVFKDGIAVQTIDLRNVIYHQILDIEEVE